MTKRSSKSTKIKKPKKNKVKKKSNEKKHENPDDGAWETDEEEELDYSSESATEKEEDERADSSVPNEEKDKSNSDKSQQRKISAGNTEETSEPSLNGCSKNVEEEKSQGSEMAEQVFGSQQQPSDTANFSFTGSINNNEKVNKKKKETLLKKSTNVTGHPLKDESKTKEQTKATEDSPSTCSQVLTRRQSALYNSGYGHQYGKNSSYDNRHKLQQDISSKNPCFVDIVIDRKQVVGVNFVVAAPFKLIDDSDRVVVICGHSHLGNWKQPLIELHKFEKISELFGVYSGKINIPEELLRSPLQYKYLVLNEDGIKFWEFLHKKNVYENRILTFQSLEGYEKHFHYQFDDIIMPEKSIGSKFKSWLKSFYKEDDLFSYLPDVFECYANNLFLKTKSNVTKSKSNLLPYKIIGLYKSFFSAESQMREYIRTPWQKLESTKIFIDWVNNYLATVKSVIVNVEFDIKDRIQTYTDALLMLSGLVNCGCQMDKLILPLCDILSLNPFCCANDVLLEELRSILQHHIDMYVSLIFKFLVRCSKNML